MKSIWKTAIMTVVIMFCLLGCGQESESMIEIQNRKSELQEEIASDEAVEKIKTEPEVQEAQENNRVGQEEQEEQEEQPAPTYHGDAILTEDNIVQVLETFLSISNEDELIKLEELPLTEEFFDQCVEKFPYVEEAGEYVDINIEFWLIDGEGKCVCLVGLCKDKNPSGNPILAKPNHIYCVEMRIVEDKIDTMTLDFMR